MQSDPLDFSAAPGDEALSVVFHLQPEKDEKASLEAGRPIFADREYVAIQVRGERDRMDRPANDSDRRRFRRQYEAFRSGNAEAVSGTPLSEWPAVSRSQVEELRYFKVCTVEQLAAMSDSALQNVGPLMALRQKARDWMAAAAGNAPVEKMRAELSERDARIAALEMQLKEVVAETKRGRRQQA